MLYQFRKFVYLLLLCSVVVLSGCEIAGSITVTPERIEAGQTVTLEWGLGANSGKASSAVIDQDIGEVPLSGSLSLKPDQTTTYTITWSGEDGTAFESVTVEVVEPPSVSFSADKEETGTGGSAELIWNASNSLSCTIEPGIGQVDMAGSTIVSPVETTTYKITATGEFSSRMEQVTIRVVPPPTVTLISKADTIYVGDSTEISWSSSNAETCSIEPGTGNVALNGTITVTPEETTTYTITANGQYGTSQAQATVHVVHPPEVSLTAASSTINTGESTVLTWNSAGAQSCSISPGIGEVGARGTISVSPDVTTVYKITATGPLSTVSSWT